MNTDSYMYRAINNKNPPLKDFRAPDFHVCFYYSQLFWQKSEFALIILTLRGGLIINSPVINQIALEIWQAACRAVWWSSSGETSVG